ncbi:MAG: HEAT repeat domain-containing protein [Anaerolineae bacterium]|nr:HEAT repeat domain-containing protein [Anaerolineae bacterium]
MGFDVENFGVGLLVGWTSAYAAYRFRKQIGAAVRSTRRSATDVQNYTTRSADNRFIHDLIEQAETTHLAGRFVNLSEIVIEPRFLPAPELVAPPDDDVIHRVFHVVPQVHDFPYLHAPYNLETLSIDDLATGDRQVALLGIPGSGRTTALLTIALHSLGRVRFVSLEDRVQKSLDAEEAALSEKARAARVKERQEVERLARERLSEQHGITYGQTPDESDVTRFNQFLPVYIHLANVHISPDEYGSQIDPAEPLVRAAQNQVGPITARTLPLNLYRRLAAGQTLLLIDGLDDLPPEEQREKIIWLQALMSTYSNNFFIVAAAPNGYGALMKLGMTPVILRPWSDLNLEQSVDRWTNVWPVVGGTRRKPAGRPEDAAIARARANNRALSPVDLTLKIWSTYGNDTQTAGFEGWLQAFVTRHLPANQPLEAILTQLGQVAALQLDEGFITLERIEALIQADAFSGAEFSEEAEAESAKPARGRGKKSAQNQEQVSAQSKFLSMLRRSGLLVSYRGGRLQFRHSFVAAYLAGLTLKAARAETLVDKANRPAWSQALAYAALHTSMEPAVRARLSTPPDLLHSQVLDVSRWLAYAPSSASWRGPLLKHIGNMLVAANQYPLVRERAAAALIGTRDRSTLLIFRQAARNANDEVRRLACLGMGAIGSTEAIKDLIALLEDQSNEVQLAAVMALGAIGNDEALEALVVMLTESSEPARQAVAETIALLPAEGHPILYDAIRHDDMLVRRAATFGLKRVATHWAIDLLYRAFLEDEQWYVRSAAQGAFFDLQQQENRGPQAYPAPDSIAWLGDWAGARGENVPAGEGAVQVLLNALQDGEPEIRELAARVLGQLGQVTAARPLYAALRDRQEEVRSAAHRSLADLETQLGQSFPAPI